MYSAKVNTETLKPIMFSSFRIIYELHNSIGFNNTEYP